MINKISLKNYGPINDLNWDQLSQINLIVGENATGKTIALKALFAALKSMEEANMGDDNRSVSDILSDKLYWTFQTNGAGLGLLVNNNNDGQLSFELAEGDKSFSYHFGVDTRKQVKAESTFILPRKTSTVYIPAKEILSLYQIILKSREQDRVFGFAETEYSLVKAMQYPSIKDTLISADHAEIIDRLKQFDDGSLEYDDSIDRWVFKSGKSRIPVGILSDGVRKVSVIERLLENNYIRPGSIVLIDEIESSLHPQALMEFIDIIYQLSQNDIQFFITTHSYITVKKMYVLAREKNLSIPTISFARDGQTQVSDMRDAFPENAIIDAARRVFEQEADLVMGV